MSSHARFSLDPCSAPGAGDLDRRSRAGGPPASVLAAPQLVPFADWVTALARRHARRLARIARSEGLTGPEALDAVQDALLTFTFHADVQKLEGDDQGGAKMLTVMVRNAARNARRRHHRAQPHDSWDDESTGSSSACSSIEDLVAQAEQHALVRGCLDTLNKVQRDVVTLRMLEELSGEEVAEQHALESSHVAVLLYRAKKKLARCLGGVHAGGPPGVLAPVPG